MASWVSGESSGVAIMRGEAIGCVLGMGGQSRGGTA
jgi:hypothetical protein